MSNNNKPILTAADQVRHLKEKGVKFNVMSEAGFVLSVLCKPI